MVRIFVFIGLVLFISSCSSSKTISVDFAKTQWIFPLTVGEAVEKYKLLYKPPGLYYARGVDGNTVTLEYSYETDDFANEYQSKDVLYSRLVRSYVHSYVWRAGLQDSLHNALQSKFNKRMSVISTEPLLFTKYNLPDSLRVGRSITYELLKVNSQLTIGLREKPVLSEQAGRNVEVFLMYNQTDDEIRKRLSSF
ncbi:hypothetical protein ACFSUS_00040 [Spirosoma soli]|uniref:DUF4136 domain-containing protein n=1 Tax=Spirosoma soli TaxID=1770529 RepID=A0ABW5LYW0_9BACT